MTITRPARVCRLMDSRVSTWLGLWVRGFWARSS
jgi:hypothetical protein